MRTVGLMAGMVVLAGFCIFASVGEAFTVEDMYDGQNETINSADDVAISPGLDERYTFMRRNRSLEGRKVERRKIIH